MFFHISAESLLSPTSAMGRLVEFFVICEKLGAKRVAVNAQLLTHLALS